jgi:response regulator RpfG family c-di-GMP phosphodiesterase
MNPPYPSKKGPVLIVDDEPHMLNLLRRMIRDEFDFFEADRAEQAEAILRQHPVKVMLCDHFMPGETGLDLAARLRAHNPAVKCILLTGTSDPEVLLQAINESRIHHYLTKPASHEEVLNALREAVEAYDREQTAEETESTAQPEATRLPYWLYRLNTLADALLHSGGSIFSYVMMLILIAGVLALLLGGGILILLYFMKSFAGIDLAPEIHIDSSAMDPSRFNPNDFKR